MVTTSNVSTIQAGQYYNKDDYYSRTITQEDFWFGKGLLSPIGDDIPNPCKNTITPLSQDNYEQKVNTLKDELTPDAKKLAIDLTFSPPKSISIAMLNPALKYDLLDAHNQAVKNVLTFVESNYVVWRKHTNKDNRTENIKTKNALFACLQHRVSREQDPQLHTHCLLFRKTMINGKIMTIEDRFIHSNQYLFSLMYDNELSKALQEKRIPLRESTSNDQKNIHFEIEGINDTLIDHFSKRKYQIQDYQANQGFSNTWDGAHAAGLASRRPKPPEDLATLEKEWRKSIDNLGGFVINKSTHKKDASRLLKINDILKKSIDHLQEKSYAFSKSDLMIEVYKQGIMLGVTVSEFENIFEHHLRSTLIQVGFRQLNNEIYFTTPKNLARAKYIDSLLLSPKVENYSTLDSNDANSKIDILSNTLKLTQGWELSKGQKEAINLMLSSSNKYIAVEGIAGSGKTTMLEQAKLLYESQGVNVIGMAFTGKAAEAMESEATISSQTIHKYLNHLSPTTTHNSWDFSSVKKAETLEVWVVDESSMLTDYLLSNILEASEKRNAKVVFLGDPNQLLPIGTGNAFARMTRKDNEQVPTVRMREINRQEEGSNLRRTVEALSGKFENIEKQSPLSYIDDSIKEIPQRQYRLNSVIHEYCNYTVEQQDKSAILVARNNDRNELNSEIHNRLVEKGTLKNECLLTSVNQYGIESSNPYAIGEKVIFTKNDYKLKDINGETVGIKNGQLGKIININGPKVTVQTNTNQNVIFDTREYKHFDYGYAMTTFKAQGITVDNALIVHDSTQKNSNTRNKIYVDVSRAKKSVKIFTDDKEALVKQAKRFQQKITSSTFTPSIVKGKERKTTHVSKEKSKEI